ncbi:Trp biosynthesis-associated membrane protein [Nocardioides sp. CFH 31398]|uniref:Trp biosynthesis-associated membrane protein n=1 Tax=Nocardioides sp. CFH 31398 TaxID=2919579 RepID=UPI001F059660|nr:Trp biosynthesis-associated membrane protein [Nocardioides sp. CFH 31398]MCH1868305.1 Trp biosynthesis-associated membrane protein [Nocardioides sp. CFH 31398]
MTEPADGPDAAPAQHTDTPPRRRSTMGPTLLVALASGALLAVAGDRPWVDVEGAPEPVEGAGQQVVTGLDLATTNPTVTALALVALAALGVVLVVRGVVRRVVAGVALLAALGVAATVVTGFLGVDDRVAAEVADGPLDGAATSWTAWAWASAPAALLLVVACAVAVRDVRRWPEMGRRYDAPTTTATARGPATSTTDLSERSALEIWRDLDEGRDPTEGPRP